MKMAVLDSGFAGSSQPNIPLVLEPARKQVRPKQARKPKRVVVPFSVSKPQAAISGVRINPPKMIASEYLEFAFVAVLLTSTFVLVFLSMVAASKI
jgi:hypothetical protein